jgi:hypothetical protein
MLEKKKFKNMKAKLKILGIQETFFAKLIRN